MDFNSGKILFLLTHLSFLITLFGNVHTALSETRVVYNPMNSTYDCRNDVLYDTEHSSIQDAVDAGGGGVIIVCPGTYTENIEINCKSLSINSFSGNPFDTIVRAANPNKSAFYVHDTGCYEWSDTISGFTITGATGECISEPGEDPCCSGIRVFCSRYGYISNNYITGNVCGITIEDTMPDWDFSWTVANNDISENMGGINLFYGHSSTIRYNNIINNLYYQASEYLSYNNNWDGNYWSDYTGIDDGSGGRTSGDGIGDTEIPHGGDNYPYMYSYGWLCSGNISKYPVMNINISEYYYKLQTAYDSAGDGDALQIRAIIFPEDLNIDLNKSVTFKGGYDCNYISNTGKTRLKGTIIISKGTLIFESGKVGIE